MRSNSFYVFLPEKKKKKREKKSIVCFVSMLVEQSSSSFFFSFMMFKSGLRWISGLCCTYFPVLTWIFLFIFLQVCPVYHYWLFGTHLSRLNSFSCVLQAVKFIKVVHPHEITKFFFGKKVLGAHNFYFLCIHWVLVDVLMEMVFHYRVNQGHYSPSLLFICAVFLLGLNPCSPI